MLKLNDVRDRVGKAMVKSTFSPNPSASGVARASPKPRFDSRRAEVENGMHGAAGTERP